MSTNELITVLLDAHRRIAEERTRADNLERRNGDLLRQLSEVKKDAGANEQIISLKQQLAQVEARLEKVKEKKKKLTGEVRALSDERTKLTERAAVAEGKLSVFTTLHPMESSPTHRNSTGMTPQSQTEFLIQ